MSSRNWQPFYLGINVFRLQDSGCASLLKIAHWPNLIFEYVIEDDGYRKTSNISRTLLGNKIVDNSDVVGASPVGAAPTTSSLST